MFIWNTLEQWSLQLILRTKNGSHISVRRINYIMGCCTLLIFPAGESKKNLCLFLIWFSFEFHQNLIDLSSANYRYPLQIFVWTESQVKIQLPLIILKTTIIIKIFFPLSIFFPTGKHLKKHHVFRVFSKTVFVQAPL